MARGSTFDPVTPLLVHGVEMLEWHPISSVLSKADKEGDLGGLCL